MKLYLSKAAFVALLMSTLAAPGYASAIIGLIGNAAGGAITTANGTVTVLNGAPFDDLVYGSTPFTVTDGVESLSGETLTVSGDISGLNGLATGTNVLFTITFSGPLINVQGAGSASLAIPLVGTGAPSLTSVAVNPKLLQDLGLGGYTPTSLVAGNILGSGTVTGGTGTYGASTVGLDVMLTPPVSTQTTSSQTSSTPEPASLVLIVPGLIATALLFRWRHLARQRT